MLDEYRKLFAPRTNETKEGRRVCALYWDIDRFLEWLPEQVLVDSAMPMIVKLASLIEGTRAIADTPQYTEYLHTPMPDDNAGRFSSNRAVRESMAQSFTHRKDCVKTPTIKPIRVILPGK